MALSVFLNNNNDRGEKKTPRHGITFYDDLRHRNKRMRNIPRPRYSRRLKQVTPVHCVFQFVFSKWSQTVTRILLLLFYSVVLYYLI